MKKSIVYLMIVSFFNLVGCYYQQQMNSSEFYFEDNGDLQVITKDTVYALSSDDYYFDNDTVFATLSKVIDKSTTIKFQKKIPISEIEVLEVKKTDVVGTIFTTMGVIAGIFLLVLAVSWSDGLY